jgi:hypothetical protein
LLPPLGEIHIETWSNNNESNVAKITSIDDGLPFKFNLPVALRCTPMTGYVTFSIRVKFEPERVQPMHSKCFVIDVEKIISVLKVI